jgi:hypothetical protein
LEYRSINFAQKFGLLDAQWQPRVVAEMNDYQFKVVKLEGDFIWHHHDNTDETFIVLDGTLRIDFRDGPVRADDEKWRHLALHDAARELARRACDDRVRSGGSTPLSLPMIGGNHVQHFLSQQHAR